MAAHHGVLQHASDTSIALTAVVALPLQSCSTHHQKAHHCNSPVAAGSMQSGTCRGGCCVQHRTAQGVQSQAGLDAAGSGQLAQHANISVSEQPLQQLPWCSRVSFAQPAGASLSCAAFKTFRTDSELQDMSSHGRRAQGLDPSAMVQHALPCGRQGKSHTWSSALAGRMATSIICLRVVVHERCLGSPAAGCYQPDTS